MTNWFDDQQKEWKGIIETVAREENRATQMVEKDTIQSMILYRLSQTSIPLVFKGGTSLSKVYGVIDRFSEDIDLSLSVKSTDSIKRNVKLEIKAALDGLGIKLQNESEIQSRFDYNRYVCEYTSLFSSMPLELIIETNFYLPAYPAEIKEVQCFVGTFCKDRTIELPIAFDAACVKMPVQSLSRTFIDKVFAVCDYRIANMQDRDSRHLYDIAKLLPDILPEEKMKGLIDQVRADRMKSKNNPSAQPEYDIPEMLLEIISSGFFEADYRNITQRLLYEDYPYELAIKDGIAKIAGSDMFSYRDADILKEYADTSRIAHRKGPLSKATQKT